MTKIALFGALLTLTACVGAEPDTTIAPADEGPDAPSASAPAERAPDPAPSQEQGAAPTSTPTGCDLDAPFQNPERIEALRTQYYEVFPRLSSDELTIYFAREDAFGGPVPRRIFVAKRASTSSPWNTPEVLANINDGTNADTDPALSPDELSLTFASSRPGTGLQDLWIAMRPNNFSNFSAPTQIAGLNTTSTDRSPVIVRDGAEIWFSSSRPNGVGGTDIYRAIKNGASYDAPVLVTELSSTGTENAIALSSDALTAYIGSSRAGGKGGEDIYVAKRANVNDPFSPPVAVTELNTDASQAPGWISKDGCRLYYHSSDYAQADYDLWVATKPPKK